MTHAALWKRAVLEDGELILPMMEVFCRLLHIPWDAAERRDQVRYLAENRAAGGVWFTTVEGVPAGYFVLTFGFSFEFRGRYGLFDELYVDERFRKLGLGGSALDTIKAIAPGLGLRRLLIEVAVESPHLATYYTRHGFALREYRLHTREVE
ncbi:MAG: GNAT family N-acetyltransferase [Candidatus Methylacidiphilales bacterium]|nr:GNAT family N-acetyltransferase [Candidatus Methylacidiphilales bacterium]